MVEEQEYGTSGWRVLCVLLMRVVWCVLCVLSYVLRVVYVWQLCDPGNVSIYRDPWIGYVDRARGADPWIQTMDRIGTHGLD